MNLCPAGALYCQGEPGGRSVEAARFTLAVGSSEEEAQMGGGQAASQRGCWIAQPVQSETCEVLQRGLEMKKLKGLLTKEVSQLARVGIGWLSPASELLALVIILRGG